MSFWRNRRGVTSAGKEIGCGLITMIVFTAPLWVFTMATRGPRYALAVLAVAAVVLVAVVVLSRALRRR
jgi:hypothetical protein